MHRTIDKQCHPVQCQLHTQAVVLAPHHAVHLDLLALFAADDFVQTREVSNIFDGAFMFGKVVNRCASSVLLNFVVSIHLVYRIQNVVLDAVVQSLLHSSHRSWWSQ